MNASEAEARQRLGKIAGALLGAKIGKDKGSGRGILSTLGGGFVGMTGGLFLADIVNRIVSGPVSAGGASVSTEEGTRGYTEEDIRTAEYRGYFRGICASAAVIGTLFHLIDSLIDGASAETKLSPEAEAEIVKMLGTIMNPGFIRDLARKNKDTLLRIADTEMLDMYSKASEVFKQAGLEFEFNILEDSKELRRHLSYALDQLTPRPA